MSMLSNVLFHVKVAWNDFLKDERGETNIIAIILIILVVIALVGFFNKSITSIVQDLFKSIKEAINGSGIQNANIPG